MNHRARLATLFSLCLGACVATAPAPDQPSSGHTTQASTYQPVDSNGDGVPDGIDLDGDGVIDVSFDDLDLDCDGTVDVDLSQLPDGDIIILGGDCRSEAIDTDGDGTLDGFDVDCDGQVDVSCIPVLHDDDGDGQVDGIDTDCDGQVDVSF